MDDSANNDVITVEAFDALCLTCGSRNSFNYGQLINPSSGALFNYARRTVEWWVRGEFVCRHCGNVNFFKAVNE